MLDRFDYKKCKTDFILKNVRKIWFENTWTKRRPCQTLFSIFSFLARLDTFWNKIYFYRLLGAPGQTGIIINKNLVTNAGLFDLWFVFSWRDSVTRDAFNGFR